MNKKSARAQAYENTRSIADLRALITSARGRGGMSTVQPAITLDRALDVYEAALGSRDNAQVPTGMRPDPYRPGHMRITGDALIIANILRDCL